MELDNSLVLVAEDEVEIADILVAYLEREGFRCVHAADGRVALQLHQALKPDMLLLDVGLPRIDGWQVLAEARRRGDTPVIMITALDQDIDKLQTRRIGADDYVVKPFKPVEVVARVHAVLRLTAGAGARGVLRVGPMQIDTESHLASIVLGDDLSYLNVTLTEYRLLIHIAAAPMPVFSRSELVDACLPGGDALDRTVDSHVSKLRRKLADAGVEDMLSGVRDVDYRLKAAS